MYPDSMAIYPNIFTLLVGPPAAGKSRVISQVTDIIKNEKLMVEDQVDGKWQQHYFVLTEVRVADLFFG